MRLRRVGYLAVGLIAVFLCTAASASAATGHARHAFKVLITPEYATAGQPTTFQVKFVNTSSRGVSLGAVQITPPKGFGLRQTTVPGGLKHKASTHQRTFSLHRLGLKPGKSIQIQITAVAPQCDKCAARWTSHAFGRGNATGPQLALQSAMSSLGVTVLQGQSADCGDGGPPCSTGLSTSPSTYSVVSDAGSGKLNETVNVGKRLTCAGYKLRDSNWYDSLVTGEQPTPAGTMAPITDQITYTITNAHSKGVGFCLGASYDFTTASGALAPKATLPSGAPGFVGLLPMCTNSKPPCISSITESSDDSVKSGVDTTLMVLIPEQGDPWGAG